MPALYFLADFGLARTQDHVRGSFLGRRSQGWGTPGFSAPEQLNGAAPATAQDIYSLGATLYHLLTGQTPRLVVGPGPGGRRFSGPLKAINKVRSAAGGLGTSRVPEAWERTIAACLEISPEKRPKTVAEVAHGLDLGPAMSQPRYSPGGSFRWARMLADLFRWVVR